MKILRNIKSLFARLPALYSYFRSSVRVDDLIRQAAVMLGADDLKLKRKVVSETGVLLLFAECKIFGGIVLKIPVQASATNGLQRNYENISILAKTERQYAFLVPRPLEKWQGTMSLEGVITAETRLEGTTASCYTYSDELQERVQSIAAIWRKNVSDVETDRLRNCLSSFVTERSSACLALSEVNSVDKTLLSPVLSRLAELAESGDFDAFGMGLSHGDFWLGNILVCADGKIGLIDWADMREVGLLELDVCHLALYSHAQRHHKDLVESWADAFESGLPFGLGRADMSLLQRDALLCLYWVCHITKVKEARDQKWLEQYMIQPFRLMTEVLARHDR